MEIEQFITQTKWSILCALAESEKSSSEIATETGSSLANISQQAKLLEAYGMITPVKKLSKGRTGKPKRTYKLNHNFTFLANVEKGFSGKTTLQLDKHERAFINIWFYEQKQAWSYLRAYLVLNEELFTLCSTIAVVSSDKQEIHLILITEKQNLEKIRNNHSQHEIKIGNETKKVISWTHSLEELEEGVMRKDEYFLKILSNPHILYDRDNLLRKLLRDRKRTER